MKLTWKRKAMRVLIKGWTGPAHSYAIVNCFQLDALQRLYKNQLELYHEEMPYFRSHWKKVDGIYPEEMQTTLRSIKPWKGEEVDLIYSITYPYDITVLAQENCVVPKCVFYTSEFASLDESYFTCEQYQANTMTFDLIKKHVKHNNSLHFTSPSLWSSRGLDGITPRDKVITHGVDPRIFHKDTTHRSVIRRRFGVADDEILLINIGAMTGNKGIILILKALYMLVFKLNKTHFKLLLKGSGDLYQSKQFLESYLHQITQTEGIPQSDLDNLIKNHVIFSDATMSFSDINLLFNASDLYVSPYLAEGFNLTVLEALASGMSVLVPETGSTKEYIQDIYNNGGSKFIYKVPSKVVVSPDGKNQNVIDDIDVVKGIIQYTSGCKNIVDEDFAQTSEYITKHYSWDNVAKLLYGYFLDIVS
jgi:glycosyltransferase involved in cell wall biosynthesis